MALSKDRNTHMSAGEFLTFPVEADTTIYAGALVAVNANGNAVPGSTATTLKAAGRAEHQVVNNPGTAGAQVVTVRRGVFQFANHGADAVGAAHLLTTCYIVDDQTVAATSGGDTRSAAGKVLAVDTHGVWVEIGS